MHIAKLAHDNERYRRSFFPFHNARSAFRAYLQALNFSPGELVLLPAYIGWSQREGSGVFDPVDELGLAYRFYRMNGRLTIDLDHIRSLFRANKVKALVIIHYFGYVDPGYREAVAIAREHGARVLEDEAHAMLTDLIGGISGRLGDAALFSLHKLLPVGRGGMLVVNRDCRSGFDDLPTGEAGIALPWEFDLSRIARKRIENAQYLASLLALHGEFVTPLREALLPGEAPQTVPVLIRKGSRDRLYEMMNDAGYGVVSLYHTMIRQITIDGFPESHALARTILNLPVHQDVEPGMLEAMVERLVRFVRKLSP